MEEARKYLLEQSPQHSIRKLIESYGNKLAIPDEAYFSSIDRSLYIDRNRIMNAYVLLFVRVQDLVNGNKTDSVKNDALKSYRIVNEGVALAQNFPDRYVVRENLDNKTDIQVYRTKDPAIQKALSALERKILNKLEKLKQSGTITDTEYRTALQAYDDFVLHLSLYRDYGKNTFAKERALSAIKTLMATYGKKVVENAAW